MFIRVPSQNQTTLLRGIRPICIFDRVVRGRVIGWTVKLPIRMLGRGLPKLSIRMLGFGSPKLCSALRKAFNSKPDNEANHSQAFESPISVNHSQAFELAISQSSQSHDLVPHDQKFEFALSHARELFDFG